MGVEVTGRGVIHKVCRSLRSEDRRPVAVLCAYGMLWEGRNVLRHRTVVGQGGHGLLGGFLEDIRVSRPRSFTPATFQDAGGSPLIPRGHWPARRSTNGGREAIPYSSPISD